MAGLSGIDRVGQFRANMSGGNGTLSSLGQDPEWVSNWAKHTHDTSWQSTTLNENDEAKFREWMKTTELVQREAKDNPRVPIDRIVEVIADPNADYDYRGAWKDGQSTVADVHDGGKQHFSSRDSTGRMLKAPSHQTSWKEFFINQYNVVPDELGLRNVEEAIWWSKVNGR